MSDKLVLSASPRSVVGKKVAALRRGDQIPANISSGKESVAVTLNPQEFSRLYHKVGDTGLFYVDLKGESVKRPVLVNDVQTHPLSGQTLHVVLRQVSLKEKVSAEVPVVLVGELGVKEAVAVLARDHVEVEALPLDLPEKFEIDLSTLSEIGQQVTYADLQYDKEKVVLKVTEDQMSEPVVLVQEVKEEVIEEPTPVEGTEGAEGTAGAATDGTTGTTGTTAGGTSPTSGAAGGAGGGTSGESAPAGGTEGVGSK